MSIDQAQPVPETPELWMKEHAMDARKRDREHGKAGRFRLLRFPIDAVSVSLVVLGLGLQVAAYFGGWSWYWFLPIIFGVRWVDLVEHNHAHLPIFYQSPLNELIGWMQFLNGGVPLEIYRLQHVQTHHGYLNKEKDWTSPFCYQGTRYPDRPVSWRYYVLTYTAISVCEAFAYFLRRPRSRQAKRFFTSLVIVFGTSGLLAYHDLRSFLLFFFFPWFVTYFGAPINNWDHHVDNEFKDIYTSGNIDLRFFSTALGLNIGFHSAHHFKPSLHWSLLPKFHWRFMAPHTPQQYYRPVKPAAGPPESEGRLAP